MAIDRPIIVEIERDLFQINEFGRNYLYLICGSERALLVDTGEGFLNIQELIREITPLPYDVVHTSGDKRSIGGAGQFREVYICQRDAHCVEELFETYSGLCRKPNLKEQIAETSVFVLPEKTRWKYNPKIHPLESGERFELGGTEVEVVHTPGRTSGSTCFVDCRSKIAFTGLVLGPGDYNRGRWLDGLAPLEVCGINFTRIYTGIPEKELSSEAYSEDRMLASKFSSAKDVDRNQRGEKSIC